MSKHLVHFIRSVTVSNGYIMPRHRTALYQRCYNEIYTTRLAAASHLPISHSREEYHERSEENSNKNRRSYSLQGAIPLLSVGIALLAYNIKNKHRAYCSVRELKAEESECVNCHEELSLSEAIEVARDLCQRLKDENGSPGLSVAVSINGKEVWSDGFGYADLENRVKCCADTVMRIASISKSITMTAVAKLLEDGDLDLDKPVNHYVPTWPEKTYKGKKVDITTRQLVSHLAGVRHYDKNCGKKKKDQQNEKKSSIEGHDSLNEKKSKKDIEEKEFYMKERFNSVTEALSIFKDDELCSLPGTEYLYTTHGWTLVSAVIEGVTHKTFPVVIKKLFKDLGMENTYLDEPDSLIYNRARHYMKNKQGLIINAPYVDLSCKWAGGGFLSTVKDLNRFGNVLLYAYQHNPDTDSASPKGYLKPETVHMIWSPNKRTRCAWDTDGHYGMGWAVVSPGGRKHGHCREVLEYFSHTGGAVGAVSALFIMPKKRKDNDVKSRYSDLPDGVVVSMISNLGTCKHLSKTALQLAKLFCNVTMQ